jgi:cell wall assembly regulator SMI1
MNARLRALRAALAASEGIELLSPASVAEVAAFEARLGVSLPDEYRAFLLEAGNGIQCDGELVLYSLEAVLQDLGRRDPRRPFWYDDAQTNALRDAMAAVEEGSTLMESRSFMSLQRSDGIPEGCLTVGDNGGNDFTVVVVTGEQRGWMWRTGEIDCPESRALYDAGGDDRAPLGFLDWFERWAPDRLGVRRTS